MTAPRTALFAKQPAPIPFAVIGGAIVAGLFAAAAAWMMMRPSPKGSGPPVSTPADTSLDVQWRRQRKDGNDCIATFEVTQGGVNGARFVAFVRDSSGTIVARDSSPPMDVTRGKTLDLRFRDVNCDKIGDWQLEVRSPKPPEAPQTGAPRSP